MKNIKLLVVMAVAIIILAMVTIFTQPTEAQRENSPFTQKREQIEDRLKQARDLRQSDREGSIAERIKLRAQNVTDRITIRSTRLQSTLDKIRQVVEKFKEKEYDIEQINQLINQSQESLSTIDIQINEALALLSDLETSTDKLAVIASFKSKTSNIYQTLSESRQYLIEAIQNLRALVKEAPRNEE